MIENPLISINISRKQALIFYEHFLIYKGIHINYKDIKGISYLLTKTKHSFNFIPTHTSSSFQIKLDANGQIYKAGSSATSFMFFEGKSQKEKEEIFARLVYVLDNLIKPFVIINLLAKYSKENELRLGNSLVINPKGFYKNRFWRKPEFLPWNQYYNSILHGGALYVYRKDEKKKYKEYFTCSMDKMNAVIMPDLLNFLFQKNGTIDKKTEEELFEKKAEFSKSTEKQIMADGKKRFCSSCGAPVGFNQKFCTNCGSKLI